MTKFYPYLSACICCCDKKPTPLKNSELNKCDPTQENQPNCPKAFLSVGSFKDKKGNCSKSPEPIFLKFCNIARECKCQPQTYIKNLDVQLPIPRMLKFVSAVASFIFRILMRVKFIFIFTNFPNFDLGKTFPILSDRIFLFLAGRRTR